MPPDLLPLVGQWGLPGLAVIMVLLGWLVPRWMHRERIADKDEQIKTWQEAWRVADARADLLAEQNTKLLNGVETTVAIVTSLAQRADPRTKEPL